MRASKSAIHSFIVLFLLLVSLSGGAQAQSVDISAPSPVRTNEVMGRIVPRDLGDARLTDHYFAFTANPGDLMITVESSNLNGDIDVFTAVGLRPLLKFSVYAESSAPINKGIFLRRREDLILRVEARTPNDDEGTYQIRFGGTFQPIAGGPFLAETETPTEDSAATTRRSSDKKTRRVSSVGARIYEPEPPPAEVAAAPTPEPTPEATPAEAAPATVEKTAEAEGPKTTPARNARSRRPASRRTPTRSRPATETANKSSNEKATSGEKPDEKPVSSSDSSSATAPGRSTTARRNAARGAPNEPTPPEPDAGPRLVIETADGTFIDRSMSTVRRVMVENGQVVVVGKDGKVQRVALSQVVRMSIAP
jgi:pyruvate/2-oxoglutarate dehydrogenase complex dihydrolipoamide acyltransferase (E2) component